MPTVQSSPSHDRLVRGLILLGWAILAVVQASFTELLHDEAYYWNYGRSLDWGYFHQPPMIALMIRAGSAILPGELGVRLLVILMSLGTLVLLERLCDAKNTKLFFAIAFSLAAVHFGSLVAAPDIPLLFFSALFLYLLQSYLAQDSWPKALLLGVVAACILYSKYHGIFLLVLSLLANVSLLHRPSTWLLIALALVLFLPHLYWNYQHDFPTYHYHYVERMEVDWDLSYTAFYLSGILVVGLPLLGPLLLWLSIRRKTIDAFERTLKVFLIGTLVIFFFLSFRGRMEANWVVSILLPCIILGYRQLVSWSSKALKWVYTLAGISLALILCGRLYGMVDLLPGMKLVNQPIHHSAEWNSDIAKLAQGRPVVFHNEYRRASMYEFYTGLEAFCSNSLDYAGSQYDLWPDEVNAQGKSVMVISGYSLWRGDSIVDVYGKQLYYQYIDSFQTYHPYRLSLDESTFSFNAGDTAHLKANLSGPKPVLHFPIEQPVTLWYLIRGERMPSVCAELMIGDSLFSIMPNTFELDIPMPTTPGEYRLMLGFSNYALPPQRNSKVYDIVVQ
ncbi:MAG: hypothetical protein RLZZ519_828 [Bacteroidota bacterium]|jgi:hypothetical protein